MRVLSIVATAVLLLGCAGPTTPFGALNIFHSKSTASQLQETTGLVSSGPTIRFVPKHQVLHGPASFKVIIEDPNGVPDDSRISLFYNGFDVSDRFMSRSERTFLDLTGRRLQLSFKKLHLPPTRDNLIKVIYYRSPSARPIVAQYQPPTCPFFGKSRDLASIPEFDAPPDIVGLINLHASEKGVNPSYVAGLIAEESSFDPLAISWKKALGLTQVTSLGEAEILKSYPDWPRYPGLSEMPLAFVKLGIVSRKIHAGNEWRLDPSLSIEGGVRYLSYLSEYWSREEKRKQLDKALGDADQPMSELF